MQSCAFFGSRFMKMGSNPFDSAAQPASSRINQFSSAVPPASVTCDTFLHRSQPLHLMQSTRDGDLPTSSAAQPVPAITLPLLISAFAGRENEYQVKRLLAHMECVLAW